MAHKNKYLLIIAVGLFITVALMVALPKVFLPEKSKVNNIPPPPPPPLIKPGEAHGVQIKKRFGDITLVVSAGIMRPNKPMPTNLLEFVMMDKGYKIKLKNIKLNLKDKDKSIELDADMALSNEEFTRMTIKGIRHINQKGFKIGSNTRAIKLSIRDDKVIVE